MPPLLAGYFDLKTIANKENSTRDYSSMVRSVDTVRQTHRISIVLSHFRGTAVAQLKLGSAIVVGRALPADILIEDPSLSRQHARFSWKEGQILVEDLGSRNGTIIAGKRIKRQKLRSGDQVQLGGVTASVQVIAPQYARHGIDSYDRIEMSIEEEVVRARTFSRHFSLLAIRVLEPVRAEDMAWCGDLRIRLRNVDRIGLYAPGMALILLPEVDGDSAEQISEALLEDQPHPLAFGIATYPHSATSHEPLVSKAIAAARKASKRRRVVISDPLPEVQEVTDEDVVIESPNMKELYRLVDRLAVASFPALIIGETGSGKELVAHAIYRRGPFANGPLKIINCAAIPATLMESVLLGHERGAFTGADRQSKGIFEQADGGVVFLDEVGELSEDVQAALLRVIETKCITRLGSNNEIEVNVRVIAATNCDLETMVEEGKFRKDLLYRLNAITLYVPPLRERLEEIEPLAELFIRKAHKEWDTKIRVLSPEALDLMREYAWPGNVRQLRNVIERALVICSEDTIGYEDMPDRIRHPVGNAPAYDSQAGRLFTLPPPGHGSLTELVREYERNLIIDALSQSSGNQSRAAERLGIARRTLVNKIRTHGLNNPD